MEEAATAGVGVFLTPPVQSVLASLFILSSRTELTLHLRYRGDKGQNFALWELGENRHVDEKIIAGDILIVSLFLRRNVPVIF